MSEAHEFLGVAGEQGLTTLNQTVMLLRLVDRRGGSETMSDLSAQCGCSRVVGTLTADKLVKLKLVHRFSHEKDRRKVCVKATRKALAVFGRFGSTAPQGKPSGSA
jgi:DNA-binding MarR family transcriptional regulator